MISSQVRNKVEEGRERLSMKLIRFEGFETEAVTVDSMVLIVLIKVEGYMQWKYEKTKDNVQEVHR